MSDVLADMCAIVRERTTGQLRYFAAADPDGEGTRDVLFLREDLEWTDRREAEVDAELREVLVKDAYEASMGADNLNQLVKVADDKVLFTGFVEDRIAVASFERGIFPYLPSVVDGFREYMQEHDIDFIALDS